MLTDAFTQHAESLHPLVQRLISVQHIQSLSQIVLHHLLAHDLHQAAHAEVVGTVDGAVITAHAAPDAGVGSQHVP